MSLKEEKREKAKKLLELARRGSTYEERATAAINAGKIIRKHKLLDASPLDGILENETVQAAKKVADVVTDPEFVGGVKNLVGTLKGLATQAQAMRSRRQRR